MKIKYLTAAERREYIYYSRLLKDLNQHTPGTLRKKADEVVRALKEKSETAVLKYSQYINEGD